MNGGRPVEIRFEGCNDGGVRVRVRSRPPGRRHDASSELSNDLFPDLGSAPCVVRIEPIEREPAGLHALVVAGDAVLVEDNTCGHGRRRSGIGTRRRLM
jgi:hypothetical protein